MWCCFFFSVFLFYSVVILHMCVRARVPLNINSFREKLISVRLPVLVCPINLKGVCMVSLFPSHSFSHSQQTAAQNYNKSFASHTITFALTHSTVCQCVTATDILKPNRCKSVGIRVPFHSLICVLVAFGSIGPISDVAESNYFFRSKHRICLHLALLTDFRCEFSHQRHSSTDRILRALVSAVGVVQLRRKKHKLFRLPIVVNIWHLSILYNKRKTKTKEENTDFSSRQRSFVEQTEVFFFLLLHTTVVCVTYKNETYTRLALIVCMWYVFLLHRDGNE